MTHRYHVEASHVGCLPVGVATFATKADATDFLAFIVADERDLGRALTGSLKRGHFSDQATFRIFIERCADPQCEWEDA